jgi:hypothetical protein
LNKAKTGVELKYMKKLILIFITFIGLAQFSSATTYATCITINKDISYKSSDYGSSENVANLQYFLNQGKYLVYYPSGYFGSATLSAVKQFQRDYGISDTGYVGNVTRTKIHNLSCGITTTLSNNNTYVNTEGNTVHSPAYTNDNSIPAGASAQCGDGTYSFSQNRRGTCSKHGGVSSWLR